MRHFINSQAMIAAHLICFAAIWTGVTWFDVAMCFGLLAIRMFGVTAGYHRYFSHRTFETGRVQQFLLAFLAMTSAQKGVLWWAANHRVHHANSDEPDDIHSPMQSGFWWAHIGWVLAAAPDPDLKRYVGDLYKYPELRWLEKVEMLPPILLGVATYLIGGWSGLIVGFFWSTVMLWHSTFTINSLAHLWGTRRYKTKDTSKNNFLLALITLGEGWHNNHHFFPGSVRQGFRWWEVDMTYYGLKVLSWVGVVWNLKQPPRRLMHQAA